MIDTVLFGAGQAGSMAARLLAGNYRPLCFADNNPERWGKTLCGLPILPPKDSLDKDPSCVCLCVVDDERASQMERQVREMGFDGKILRLDALHTFDVRAAALRLLAGELNDRNIPGDAAELGVYRGGFAALINSAFPRRTLRLFDTFTGFPSEDVQMEREMGLAHIKAEDFLDASVELVRERMPFPETVKFYKGRFPESFSLCPDTDFAFVSIDADLYAPTAAALPLFWKRLNQGGIIMVHDYNSAQFPGAGRAVREFCRKNALYVTPLCDLHGSCVLVKP